MTCIDTSVFESALLAMQIGTAVMVLNGAAWVAVIVMVLRNRGRKP